MSPSQEKYIPNLLLTGRGEIMSAGRVKYVTIGGGNEIIMSPGRVKSIPHLLSVGGRNYYVPGSSVIHPPFSIHGGTNK